MNNAQQAPDTGAWHETGENFKVPLSPIGNRSRDNVPLLRDGSSPLSKVHPNHLFLQNQQAVDAKEEAEKKLEALQADHQRLQHKFETTNSKFQNEDISGLQDMVDHLHAELSEKEALIQQFQREAMESEDELRLQMNEDVFSLQETVRELRMEVSQKNSAIELLRTQVKDVQEKYMLDIEALKSKLARKEAEIGEYHAGATQTQKELLERTELGIEAMRETMDKHTFGHLKIIEKLKKDNRELRQTNGRLSVTTSEGGHLTLTLENQIDELNKAGMRKADIIEEYSLRMKSLEKEIVEWKTKYEMAESTRESLEGMSKKFLTQRDHAKRVTELEVRLDESQRATLELKENLRAQAGSAPGADLTSEIARLQQMLQDARVENQEAMEGKEQLWEAQKEIAVSLQTKLETFDADALPQIKDLIDENASLKARLAESEIQLEASVKKMKEVESHMQDLSNEVSLLGEVKKEKEELEMRFLAQMETLNQTNQANEELEFKVIELKEQQTQLNVKKEDYKTRVKDNAENLKALQAENESLIKDNQTLQKLVDRLQEEKETEKETLHERLNAILEENRQLQKDISSRNNELNKMEDEYEFAKQKLQAVNLQADLSGERYPDQVEFQRLESENNDLRQKKEQFEDQMHDLERQCTRLEKQCNDLSQNNVDASDELSRMKKKNKKLNEEKEDLEAELDSVKKHHRRQLDQAQMKIENLELGREQYESSYGTLVSDYERLKEIRRQHLCNMESEMTIQIDSVTQENSSLCEEVMVLGQRLQKLNIELEEVVSQNLLLESANKRLETNIVDFENAVSKATEQKAKTQKMLQAAENSLEMLQTELNEREEQVVDLEQIVEAMRVEKDELQKRMTTTEADLSEMHVQYTELNKQYQELMDNFMKVDARLQREIDYTMKVNESNARLTKALTECSTPRPSVEEKRSSSQMSEFEVIKHYVKHYPDSPVNVESVEAIALVEAVNELVRGTQCDSRAKIEVLCQQIRDLQPEAEECDNLKSNLQETSDALLVAQLDLSNAVEEKKLIIQAIEKDIEELNLKIEESRKENQSLHEKLVGSGATIEKLESRETQLVDEVQALTTEIGRISEDCDERQMREHIMNLDADLHNAQKANQQLQQDFDAYKVKMKQIVDKNQSNWAEERANLKEELKTQCNKMSLYLEENQLLEKQLSNAEQWNDELKAELSDASPSKNQDLQDLQHALTQSLEQNSLQKQVIDKQKEEYDDLEEQHECEMADLEDESERLHKQSEDQRKQLETLHAENMRLQKERQYQTGRLESTEIAKAEWLSTRDAKENEIAQLTERAESAEERVAELRTRIAGLERAAPRHKIAELSRRVEQAEKQSAKLKMEITALERNEARLQTQLADERKRFEEMFSQKCALKQEVAFLTNAKHRSTEAAVASQNIDACVESAKRLEHLIAADDLSSPARDSTRPQDLLHKIAQYRDTVEELESQLMQSNKDKDALQVKLDAFKLKPMAAHRRLNDTMKLIRRLSNQNDGKETETLQRAVEMLEGLLEHYFIRFDTLLNEQQGRYSESDQYRENNRDLEFKLHDLTEEHTEMMNDVEAHYKSLLDEKKGDLIQAIAQRSALESELKAFRNGGDREKLLQEIQTLKEQHREACAQYEMQIRRNLAGSEGFDFAGSDGEVLVQSLRNQLEQMRTARELERSEMQAMHSTLEHEREEMRAVHMNFEHLQSERESDRMESRTVRSKIESAKLFVLHMFDVFSLPTPESHDLQNLLETILQSWTEREASFQTCHEHNKTLQELNESIDKERIPVAVLQKRLDLQRSQVESLEKTKRRLEKQLLEKQEEVHSFQQKMKEKEHDAEFTLEQQKKEIQNLKHNLQGYVADATRWQQALETQRWDHAAKWEEMQKKHQQEIDDLRVQLQDRTQDGGKLREDLSKSLQELSSLRNHSTLSQSRELRAEEFASLQKEREFLHIQLAAAEKRAIDAEKQLQKMKTTGSEIERALEKDLKQKNGELEKAREAIKEMQTSYSGPAILDVKNRVDDLLTQFHSEGEDDTSRKLKQMEIALKESQHQAHALDQECAGLKEQVQILTSERKQMLDDVAMLQDELSQLQAHGICLQEEVSERKRVLEVFNSLFELVNGSSTDSLEESAIYHSDNWMKTLMSTIRDLQSCLETKLKKLRWAAESDMMKLQSELETARSQAEADSQNWETERERMQEKIERVKDKFRFQSVDMLKLKESYNEANRKLMRMENAVGHTSKETEIRDLCKEVKDLIRALESEKAKRDHFEKKCENLEHHSARIDQSVLRTKKSLSQVELEKHELKASLHDAKLERDQIQNQYSVLKGKYDGLKKQFWTIKKRYDRMENVLRKKSTSFLQDTPNSSSKKESRSREKRV